MKIAPVPVGLEPTLASFLFDLRNAVLELSTPTQPHPVFAASQAELPPAADYRDGVVRVADLNILAVSDGTDWIRQDTGAAL